MHLESDWAGNWHYFAGTRSYITSRRLSSHYVTGQASYLEESPGYMQEQIATSIYLTRQRKNQTHPRERSVEISRS
jgi:hypothetical protein